MQTPENSEKQTDSRLFYFIFNCNFKVYLLREMGISVQAGISFKKLNVPVCFFFKILNYVSTPPREKIKIGNFPPDLMINMIKNSFMASIKEI